MEIIGLYGDCDGDGYVTLADWNALYTLLDDASGYALQFAGLGATGLCHGDTSCNQVLDPNDLDVLSDWLFVCDQCPGGEQQQQEYTAEEMAKALADATPPERYDLLVEGSAMLSETLPSKDRRDYWAAVHACLDK